MPSVSTKITFDTAELKSMIVSAAKQGGIPNACAQHITFIDAQTGGVVPEGILAVVEFNDSKPKPRT